MSSQKEDVLNEIFVEVDVEIEQRHVRLAETYEVLHHFINIPNAVVYHHTIESEDGVWCTLKEKLDHKTGEVKKINKDILIDMEHRYPPKRAFIPAGTCNLYSIKQYDHIRLLIKEVIHNKNKN